VKSQGAFPGFYPVMLWTFLPTSWRQKWVPTSICISVYFWFL